MLAASSGYRARPATRSSTGTRRAVSNRYPLMCEALESTREVPAITAMHDRDVVVTACGRILHRKRVNLSHVFAGQRVGIKEVDEGI